MTVYGIDGYKLEINVAPDESTPVYAELAAGISGIKRSMAENVTKNAFIGDGGFASSNVTGGQLIAAISGVRVYGDAAQDYIFSDAVKNNFRGARITQVKLTYPDGAVISAEVTLAHISEIGGKVGGSDAIYAELHFNGKPTLVTVG